MKAMKKLMALALVLTMVLALATTAFAAEKGGTIQINGTSGTKYNVYQIMTVENNGGVKVYKLTTEWADFLSYPNVNNYLESLPNGNVAWKTGVVSSDANAAALAELAKGYAKAKPLSTDKTVKADTEGNTVKVSNDGVYLLVADLEYGTSGIVTVTGGNTVTVNDKNPVGGPDPEYKLPNVVKKVHEDADLAGTWVDANTADIGQTIEFKTTITVAEGATNYVLHDAMDTGLTYISVNEVVRYTKATSTETTLNSASDYTVSTAIDDGCAFHITFSDAILAELKDTDTLTVYYTAKLNENASSAGEYVNTTWLTHTAENVPTASDSTTTTTEHFEITKTDGTNALAGAGFTLTGSNGTLSFVQLADGTYQVCMATGCTHAHVSKNEVISGADGKIVIDGLDADEYTIHEAIVPAGYVQAADKTEYISRNKTTNITIVNTKGNELPSTGGMGTTMFYVVGAVLVVAAVALVATKKRYAAK